MMKKNPNPQKPLAHFRDIHLKFMRFYTRMLTQSGLTLPKYVLLSQISLAGKISMTEASEKLYISKPALTHMVQRLEKDKLIKRTPHSRDRRSYLLEVLPRGKKTVTSAQGMIRKFILHALKDLSPLETETIDKFYRNLSIHMERLLTQLKPKSKIDGDAS